MEASFDDERDIRIGRIVHGSALLEWYVRGVWTFLASGSRHGFDRMPKTMSPLCDGVKKLVRSAGLTESQTGWVDEAVAAARAVYDERSRVVHDLWFSDSEHPDPSRWSVQRHDSLDLPDHELVTRWDLARLDRIIGELRRAQVRTTSITFAVMGERSGTSHVPPDQWAIVRGEFEFNANGSYRVVRRW